MLHKGKGTGCLIYRSDSYLKKVLSFKLINLVVFGFVAVVSFIVSCVALLSLLVKNVMWDAIFVVFAKTNELG